MPIDPRFKIIISPICKPSINGIAGPVTTPPGLNRPPPGATVRPWPPTGPHCDAVCPFGQYSGSRCWPMLPLRRGMGCTMKLLKEYLEHALAFESLAAQQNDPEIRAQFEQQATSYAAERAEILKLPLPRPA